MHLLPARFCLLLIAAILGGGVAIAQHCGGPCEVPRGDDPRSSNPKYTLSEGVEKANWRYLFNWYWTEDGEQIHRVESVLKEPPCGSFGYRRMFPSPSGNGFLVTGNPYSADYRREGTQPPLFVFCSPEGKRLTEVYLQDAFEREDERVLSPCPSCECKDVLYVFAQDPRLTSDGCFVELTARGSHRTIQFFLPLGCPVYSRDPFERAIAKAEWSTLTDEEKVKTEAEIQSLLSDLNSDQLQTRRQAASGLLAKGYLARNALHKARRKSNSGNFRARATAVIQKLRPFASQEWESIPRNLDLLSHLLSYDEAGVVAAVMLRLDEILPASKNLDPEARVQWIQSNRQMLKWNQATGQYHGHAAKADSGIK